MSYWQAVLLMLILVILAPITFGVAGTLILIILLMRRRQLRQVYNHAHPVGRSWFEDICFICCWPCNLFLCCMFVQEAREVAYTSPKQLEVGRTGPLQPQYQPQYPRSSSSPSFNMRSPP